MLDCVVYVSSVANPHKHPRKIACLENFAAGVQATGHGVHVEWTHKYTPSKLAVMLGWATTNTGGPNIALRKEIIREQQRLGQHTMCIDASCWKYLDDTGTYLRYSLGGPFYDRAEYANHNSTSAKWQEISNRLNISLKPPRTGPNILICMQRDGGFAMKTLDPIQWASDKITEIRKYTQRPIVIRPHPGSYNMPDFDRFKRMQHVSVIDPKQSKLIDNLRTAHSVIVFNSSAAVAAVCEGVSVFADDSSCVAWDVANKNIADIEQPKQFSRDRWVWDLSAAHWNDDDGRSGRIWKKFLPYLN
jgi:hypothetical protein